MLAKEFDSSCCFDIKLNLPGTPVATLWKTVRPTLDKPLIIQIDEFDILLHKIHHNKISEKQNEWMRSLVYDKQSYNTFLSETLTIFPYVIYVFTMNSSPDDIRKLDKSYIRNNRIDLILNL